MLAFDLSIFMPFSFPESLPLPLPMSSLPFVKRVTGGSPQGLGQESVWVGANRRLVGENSVGVVSGVYGLGADASGESDPYRVLGREGASRWATASFWRLAFFMLCAACVPRRSQASQRNG